MGMFRMNLENEQLLKWFKDLKLEKPVCSLFGTHGCVCSNRPHSLGSTRSTTPTRRRSLKELARPKRSGSTKAPSRGTAFSLSPSTSSSLAMLRGPRVRESFRGLVLQKEERAGRCSPKSVWLFVLFSSPLKFTILHSHHPLSPC